MIDEQVPLKYKHIFNSFNSQVVTFFENKYKNVIYTGTGRFALKLILDYYRSNGIINDKNTQILVPQWMCMSVYHTFHKNAFPVITKTNNVKGIFVYHQYGFPQNMDEILEISKKNNWFVIENCVNVIESYYKDKLLGTLGDASIFSLSKMFPTIQGGALIINKNDIIKNIDINNYPKSNFIYVMSHLTRLLSQKYNSKTAGMLQEMVYGQIEKAPKLSNLSRHILNNSINSGAIEKRRNNYYQYLYNFANYDFLSGLEKNVIPYVVPFIANEKLLIKIKNKLINSGINTNIYNFDINRNLLNPSFKKCLWLPVHQELSINEIDNISNLIKSVL